MKRLLFGALAALPLYNVQAASVETTALVESELSVDGADSDITLATVELGFDAEVGRGALVHLLFLYEEDVTEPIALDEGTVSFAFRNDSYILAGKTYLPFGQFDSFMISDPLTLQLGETNESAFVWGFDSQSVLFDLYTFRGAAQTATQDTLQWGIRTGWHADGLELGVGYLSDFADSDTLQEVNGGGAGAAGSTASPIGGQYAYLTWNAGNFTLIAEQVAATGDFATGDFNGALSATARPRAANYELGYGLTRRTTIALGMTETQGAEFAELPRSVALGSLAHELSDGVFLKYEYSISQDYSDNQSTANVVQLSAEF